MSERNSSIEQSQTPPASLEQLSLAIISDLINEAQHAEAFMPTVAKPEQPLGELMEKFQRDPQFAIFGYRDEAQPTSFIVALSHGEDSDTLAIGPMYVAANQRGQGLGKRQVNDFLAHALSSDYRRVYTKTWSSNAASRRIFEDPELGFRQIETIPHDRANGDDSLGYLLVL